MEKNKNKGIGFFERYLTIWVLLCMAAGILIGKFLPGVPSFLEQFEYAEISMPIAILIWIMIYPMMMKVDFQSIKNVRKKPGGAAHIERNKLAHKTLSDVRARLLLLLHCFQSVHYSGTGTGLCGRGRTPGGSSMYGDGICLEQSDE